MKTLVADDAIGELILVLKIWSILDSQALPTDTMIECILAHFVATGIKHPTPCTLMHTLPRTCRSNNQGMFLQPLLVFKLGRYATLEKKSVLSLMTFDRT